MKVEAARADRSLREVVEEALTAWLERAEDDEDRASAVEALQECRGDGASARFCDSPEPLVSRG